MRLWETVDSNPHDCTRGGSLYEHRRTICIERCLQWVPLAPPGNQTRKSFRPTLYHLAVAPKDLHRFMVPPPLHPPPPPYSLPQTPYPTSLSVAIIALSFFVCVLSSLSLNLIVVINLRVPVVVTRSPSSTSSSSLLFLYH